MPEPCYVIRRGQYKNVRYWSGFKEQHRARSGLTWSLEPGDALRFVRETDAQQIIVGMRLWKRRKVVPVRFEQ